MDEEYFYYAVLTPGLSLPTTQLFMATDLHRAVGACVATLEMKYGRGEINYELDEEDVIVTFVHARSQWPVDAVMKPMNKKALPVVTIQWLGQEEGDWNHMWIEFQEFKSADDAEAWVINRILDGELGFWDSVNGLTAVYPKRGDPVPVAVIYELDAFD